MIDGERNGLLHGVLVKRIILVRREVPLGAVDRLGEGQLGQLSDRDEEALLAGQAGLLAVLQVVPEAHAP